MSTTEFYRDSKGPYVDLPKKIEESVSSTERCGLQGGFATVCQIASRPGGIAQNDGVADVIAPLSRAGTGSIRPFHELRYGVLPCMVP